ncbi:MAG: hypothetical protein M1338_01240 [Patescibacteria group bacterium]|nr:hypothetical protein [Patescibacteria group bacterium]
MSILKSSEERAILDFFNITPSQIEKWINYFKFQGVSRYEIVMGVIRFIIGLCRIECKNRLKVMDGTNIFMNLTGEVANHGECKDLAQEIKLLEESSAYYEKSHKEIPNNSLFERKKWLELYHLLNIIYIRIYDKESIQYPASFLSCLWIPTQLSMFL